MRSLFGTVALVFSVACGAVAGGGEMVPRPPQDVRPATSVPVTADTHLDEAARRAAICSEERPLDFYDNRGYCLGDE